MFFWVFAVEVEVGEDVGAVGSRVFFFCDGGGGFGGLGVD